MGFEPTTLSLARRCSTTEPLPLVVLGLPRLWLNLRAEGQSRTGDTGIFSAVLYHLSYLGSCAMVIYPYFSVKLTSSSFVGGKFTGSYRQSLCVRMVY